MFFRIFAYCFLIQAFAFAQSGWIITPGSPYDFGRFEDMFFINPQTGWIIKTSGVIYKTTNSGNNWIYLDSLGNTPSLTCIGFKDSNTGWIGTTNPSALLYKSTNGGFNWFIDSSIPVPVPTGINKICIMGISNIYMIGSSSSPSFFVKSTDGGNHWISSNLSSFATILLDCYFFNENFGFAVGGIGTFPSQTKPVIIYTSDAGENWLLKYTGSRLQSWCWQTSFPSQNTGYVCIESFGPPSTFLKTTNGGNSWIEMMLRSNPGYSQQAIGFINNETGWIGGWSDTTFATTNGGSNWHPAGFGVNLSKFRFFKDSTGYSSGQYIYKYDKSTSISSYGNFIQKDFSLYQNFPNPFNPVTKISFELHVSHISGQVSSYVKLTVYDILGNIVAVLVNEAKQAGYHETEFSGVNLASGIYFYVMKAGSYSAIKRMILLK